MKFRLTSLTTLLLLVCATLLPARAAAAPEKIRLGTLAPKGTSFHQILLEMGTEWTKVAGGQGAQLTVFPDGTMGSETDMVRRMRLGQLQGALITVTGLAQIESGTAVLQNMPFAFRSLEEAAHVREKLGPELEKRLEAKGFIVLGWTEGGWVQFFSRQPIATPADVRKLKIFAWAGDKDTQTVARDLGFKPVPAETADILIGLNTGLFDIVPAPPFYALAGQFFGPAPYLLEINYAPIVGGIVVTKKVWDKLDEPTRAALRASGAAAGARITTRARQEMTESIDAMVKRGVKHSKPEGADAAAWNELAEAIRPKLRDTVIDGPLFDQAIAALEAFRAAQSK